MSFDGSGTFLRVMSWAADAAAGIFIKSDRHDAQDDDFANGLSNAMTKDGQSQPTNNIPMNAHRLINLADPVNPQDAATKAYADLIKPSTSGFEVSGADANGKVTFSSLTGVNGLAWTGADLAWVARLPVAAVVGPPAVAAKPARLCLNDKPDGSGTDAFILTDDGSLTALKNFDIGGTFKAGLGGDFGGNITITGASALLAVRSTTGNAHVYLQNGAGVMRAIMYTASGSNGNLIFQLGSGHVFQMGVDGNLYAHGGSYLQAGSGNVVGTVWSNWGYSDAYNAISARIEARAQAWAVQYANSCVQSARMAGIIEHTWTNSGGQLGVWAEWGAYVITGFLRNDADRYSFRFRQPQVYYPVYGWVSAFPY